MVRSKQEQRELHSAKKSHDGMSDAERHAWTRILDQLELAANPTGVTAQMLARQAVEHARWLAGADRRNAVYLWRAAKFGHYSGSAPLPEGKRLLYQNWQRRLRAELKDGYKPHRRGPG